jgi:flagellar motility protein MotE (MotC chaperone)
MGTAAGTATTDSAILERLAQRRAELEARESEIGMREALVAAAEKRIEERTAKLEALEKQIGALVDQKKGLEEAEFKGLVTMYEGMKAKDAAAIFDDLDLNVLIRLARSMNPRKMSPIMAAMNPERAQQVTVQLAAAEAAEEAAPAPGDLASLPQIVGQ